MPFTPYTIDTGSAATTAKVTGLLPGKQYQFSVAAKNVIGVGAASNVVTATMAAQAATSTPALVPNQTSRFRADGPTAPASVTCSLPSVPSAGNRIIVMIRAYGGGGDNGAITGPPSATLIAGPYYDSITTSEVMYEFMISNDVSNSYTFTGWDTTSNVGIMLQEVSGVTSWDVQHGAATETGTTSLTWTFTPPTSSNCIRLVSTSFQFAPGLIGAGSTGITVLSADPASVVYHAGFLASVSPTTTSGSVAIVGGQGNALDGPVFLSTNLYGSTAPAAVQNFVGTNITSAGLRLAWSALSDTSVSAYTIQYQGGGISTWTTFGLPLPATSTNATITGLVANTSYQFRVYGSNAAGIGATSAIVSITTLAQSTLGFVQKASASDIVGGAALSTLTATFSAPTTVGNTIVAFFTGFADTNNLALPMPTGAQGWTGILQDGGGDPICAGWYLTVSSPQTTYNFNGIDDAGSFHVLEYQGVTSVDAMVHGGPLTYTNNASVTLPVVQPTTTPALSVYLLNMTNTPDSWGSPPAGFTLRSSITGNAASTITYHQGSVFEVASTVTTGNKVVPFSLLGSVVQAAAPTYIGVTLHGSASATPPGQVSGVVLGTSTTSTQPISWSAATGTVTAYAVQYRVTGSGASYTTFANNITATNTTVTGLTAGTSYDYIVLAFNGSTAGTASAVSTGSTLSAIPGQSVLTLGTATSTTQPLTWTAASGTVTSYSLFYKLATAGSYSTFATGLTGTSSTITGLVPATSYNFQIIAYNGTTAGPTSTVVTGSTLALTPPGQPSGVTLGTATGTSQPISWTASTGTVTTYSVLYSSASSSGPWTTLPGITGTSTTVSGLIPSTVYYYEVIAYNGSSPSGASTVVNRTTAAATAPGTVTGITVGNITSSTIAYTWSVPSGTVTSYTFQWKQTSGSSFTSVTGLVNPTYTLTGLSPSTSYTVQVLALSYTVPGSASTTTVTSTAASGGGTGTQMVLIGGKLLLVGGQIVKA